MPKLTKTVIDNATGTDLFLWDNEVPGFGVRIQGDRKTYVVRYRNANRTQRKMKIARCCDMTPDKARDAARKVFAQVSEGKDPAAAKQEARDAPTTQELYERYMREHARPFKKPRSVEIDEGTWSRHILPNHGAKKVAEWTKSDVLKLQGELVTKKAVANQVVALLGKSFNLAEDWGWRPQNSNPCQRLKKYKLQPRSLILSTPQIVSVDTACNDLVEDGRIDLAMASLARLWLITGCRNSEIRTAERAWVNFDLKALVLPDSKVGDREIPLPDVALDIVRELDAEYGEDRKWLIPGRTAGKPLASPWKRWKRIAASAGISTKSSPHTLRHTVGSVGHRTGKLSQKQVAMQLGHAQLSTTERYIHGDESEHAEVARKVAEVITVNWKTRQRVDEPTAEPKVA